MPPTISLTMIVRNEETVLSRCLDSAKGAYDELIVIDTGSTDGTRDVVFDYDGRVFDEEWVDDFAYVRNRAIAHASGDWLFWLDADDILINPAGVRAMAESAPDFVAGFSWPYRLGIDGGAPMNGGTMSYDRERLIRNDGRFRWVAPVHEVLVNSGPGRMVRNNAVFVAHAPLADKPIDRGRNVRILERAAASGPLEPRMLFYLARELRDAGRTGEAIETFDRYLDVSHWDDERYQALIDAGRIDGVRGQSYFYRALQLRPDWPAAYFGMAWVAYLRKDWPAVIRWSDVGRVLPMPDTGLFVEKRALTFDWIISYTYALFQLGRVNEAVLWTHNALAIDPTDSMHRANLAYGMTLLPSSTNGAEGFGAAGESEKG